MGVRGMVANSKSEAFLRRSFDGNEKVRAGCGQVAQTFYSDRSNNDDEVSKIWSRVCLADPALKSIRRFFVLPFSFFFFVPLTCLPFRFFVLCVSPKLSDVSVENLGRLRLNFSSIFVFKPSFVPSSIYFFLPLLLTLFLFLFVVRLHTKMHFIVLCPFFSFPSLHLSRSRSSVSSIVVDILRSIVYSVHIRQDCT